jgi:hypothetical protein
MAKRICYIHIGPHKTGSSAIQWFLKENRGELLKQSYFVPESGANQGGHHAIARQLCGQDVPDHQQFVAAKFARSLEETPSKAVVISSEVLEGLLRRTKCAKALFNRIAELNLDPKLVLFPRNQPQSINSRYAQVVKDCRCFEAFEAFAQGLTQRLSFGYSHWIELADTFDAELIACPFTAETIAHGIIPKFLQAIGINASKLPDTNVRRNYAAGPFTVAVGRRISELIFAGPGKRPTWLQAGRCKRKLAVYLEEKGWSDIGYCGLTTALAGHIERQWRPDNDAFAQRVWGRPWTEIFASDIGREFRPNDFDICKPDEFTERRLYQAVSEMTEIVKDIMLDPALAIQASWNDLLQRAG